ncbi:IclR family transcriptional regulator [Microbacterium resistens]|uniref:IclR family transcriptional regulator n=1 Tax=Microbacterium resistens TaxID=156977 RepID=A0ABY3RZW9_9MICO|nr:IclR family transcriptional regulator [Microbacterium resistens]UGS28222.1 IclR family transcriptional regulator [Microbacterium resistens]
MDEPGDRGAKAPPLQTVDRALAVLLSFSGRRTDWGVTDLAHEFDLDKSAAQRLLSTLAARGFLHADPVTRRYRLGAALWRIASTWERRGGMAALVEAPLADLADESSRTAVFGLADGAYVRCIAAVDGGTSPMRDHPLVGELYPAHAGATSRAYFAFLSAGQRQQLMYHRPLAKFSDLTALDAAAIEAEMLEVAEQGWAYSEGEYDLNTRALAAPVFVTGRPIGSVSIGEHKREDLGDIRVHLDAVLRTAQRISQLLSPHLPSKGSPA